jgi:DNA adenine methylase
LTAHARRPLVRWHGGKWKIAKWVIEHFPPHSTYVEPFGGGASVLLQKKKARAECYNDLDETLIGLFRVLQDPAGSARLVELLEVTPFSRAEFDLAYEKTDDPVERARRTLIRSFMGYGSDGTAGVYKTGFRRTVTHAAKFPAAEWKTYPKALRTTIDRFRDVVLEQTDAGALMLSLDSPSTLFYIDPPYHPSTRSAGNRRRGQGFHVYSHEMEHEDHVALLELLSGLKGMVVLSGYPLDLYDEALPDWRRVERDAYADGGRARTECLWINPAAQERMTTAGAPVPPRLSWEEEHVGH